MRVSEMTQQLICLFLLPVVVQTSARISFLGFLLVGAGHGKGIGFIWMLRQYPDRGNLHRTLVRTWTRWQMLQACDNTAVVIGMDPFTTAIIASGAVFATLLNVQ